MISRAILFIGGLFIKAGKKLEKRNDSRPIELDRWINDKGDKTSRLDYVLDSSSLVIDVGGYEGQWASDIYSMYGCTIIVFEPVTKFANFISKRFIHNDRIKVIPKGLSGRNSRSTIAVADDSSSFCSPIDDKATQLADLIRASDFFEENYIVNVDLMKINIEGGEYDLLDHLIETNLIQRIGNIQIQFHNIFPDAEKRMNDIQSRLSVTHQVTYQYKFVWENWQRKKVP